MLKDLTANIAQLWASSHPPVAVVEPSLNQRYHMAAKPYLRMPVSPPVLPDTDPAEQGSTVSPPTPAVPACVLRNEANCLVPLVQVRVGIISYQLYDNPVGRLIRCVVDRLAGYTPAMAPALPGLSLGGGNGRGAPQFRGVRRFNGAWV